MGPRSGGGRRPRLIPTHNARVNQTAREEAACGPARRPTLMLKAAFSSSDTAKLEPDIGAYADTPIKDSLSSMRYLMPAASDGGSATAPNRLNRKGTVWLVACLDRPVKLMPDRGRDGVGRWWGPMLALAMECARSCAATPP